jgi:endoglucanase
VRRCMFRLRLMILILGLSSEHAYGTGFLQTDGRFIVDADGNTVLLRGFGLGGWLVQEGYMWNIHGFVGSPSNIESKIIDLVGTDNSDAFYQAYYENYITEADVAFIAANGFNVLRVPFHYKFFSPAPGEYVLDGFNLINQLLEWCAEYGVYLILDMHCAPGGQNTNDFSDGDGNVAGLWTQQSYREWATAVWGYIADYYADEEWIAGYDLLNEPVLSGGFTSTQLRQFYIQMTNTIRDVDTNHIIFIEGNWYGNDFTNLTPPYDDNMAYSFHHYIGPSHQTSWLGQYTSMSQTYNIPLWVGEFGENSNHWAHKKIQLFENNDVNWTLWNYKHNGSVTAAVKVVVPNSFNSIIEYWNESGQIPSASQAVAGLMDLAEAYKFDECVLNKGLIAGLSDPDFNSVSKPFTEHTVPGVIDAVDYDIGANGIAYNDNIYEDPDKFGSNSQSWNNGWVYRNDGVDIECSSDVSGTGCNIGWIENGEWLKYTVYAEFSGHYQFSFKVSSPYNIRQIVVTVQEQAGAVNFQIPNTGGYENWQWTNTASVYLEVGENVIKLQIINGNLNLKSIKIEGTNPNPIPKNYLVWNYPNPFNGQTTFSFLNNIDSPSVLNIYDISGYLVQNIEINPDATFITWDGKDRYGFVAVSGIYVYQVKFDQKKFTGKMTIIR